MKRLTLILLLLTFCATAFAGESQLQKATNVVNEIMGTPDKGIPHDLLNKAECVGIISYIPMASSIKTILNVVMVICVILWLLRVFGLLHH